LGWLDRVVYHYYYYAVIYDSSLTATKYGEVGSRDRVGVVGVVVGELLCSSLRLLRAVDLRAGTCQEKRGGEESRREGDG